MKTMRELHYSTAGFQTCRIADFQIGRALQARARWISDGPRVWKPAIQSGWHREKSAVRLVDACLGDLAVMKTVFPMLAKSLNLLLGRSAGGSPACPKFQMLTKNLNFMLATLLAVLGGGCSTIQDHSLTYALWSDSRGHSYCRPQADPGLKLFNSDFPPDVLVEYNAVSDRNKGVQRRAYFLAANARRLAASKPPRFVDVRREAGLAPIPIMPSESNKNPAVSTNDVFAVAEASAFTLYRPESSSEYCLLPNYPDGAVVNPWERGALTPLAVTADAVVDVTVIGVVVGVAGGIGFLYACCESNVSWRP